MICPLSPGLIGSLGYWGTVHPHDAIAWWITNGPSPVFLNLVEKLNIQWSDNNIDYLRTEKPDLYNLLEKKNLFDKLNISLKNKKPVKKNENIKNVIFYYKCSSNRALFW